MDKYEEAKALAIKVKFLCEEKLGQYEELVAKSSEKVSNANAEDNKKNKLTGVSNVMRWKDEREDAMAEVKFYKTMIENSKVVVEKANVGIRKVMALKEGVKRVADLSKFRLKADALA